MSALALAADAASAPDWVARWLGIAGLVVSVVTVFVTVSLWRRDGWRLSVLIVEAYGGLPPVGKGLRGLLPAAGSAGMGLDTTRSEFYQVKVTNTGRMPCVVSEIGLRYRAPTTARGVRFALSQEIELDSGKLPVTLAPTETFMVDVRMRQTPTNSAGVRWAVGVTSGTRRFTSQWVGF
jgi:hypothetical protein